MSTYLSVEDVLGIHHDSIHAFGGSHGLRDQDAFESAVMRPQSGYYEDPIAEAAALWESLSQNHPFVDGNKRTAIASMAAHLSLNGYWLHPEALATHAFMMNLYAAGTFKRAELEKWLRSRVALSGRPATP